MSSPNRGAQFLQLLPRQPAAQRPQAPDHLLAGDCPPGLCYRAGVSDSWECSVPSESLTLAIATMATKRVTGDGTFSDGVSDVFSSPQVSNPDTRRARSLGSYGDTAA